MRGRHVLLLNPDATLSPRAIPRLVAILEKFPRVGLVAPTLLGSTGKPPRPPLLPCPTLGRMFVAQTPVRHIARWLPRRRWRPVPDVPIAAGYLTGACLLIRGALLGDVGPLDARYFFSFEDVDYADRAVAAGWTLLWTDAVAVQHGGGASTRQFDAGWRHWQFLRGARRYFASRHAGGAFALAWPLFKVLHAQSLVAMWLESGTKRTAYARLGHPAAAAKHDRRRRLAGGFLSRYAWRIFSW